MNDEDTVNFSGAGESGSVMIDMSGVPDQSYEIIPRGRYPGRIIAQEFKYSQSNNNPMWELQVELEGDEAGEHAGRKLYTHIVFSEKALPRAKKTLRSLRPELLEGPFDPEQLGDAGILCDLAVWVQVGTQRYEGEMRNNVRDLTLREEAGGGFV